MKKKRSAKGSVWTKQMPLILIAATGILLTIVYFVYRGLTHSQCDSIFEQTTDRLHANLDAIKIKGELALGQEKVQELSDGAQKVALHLKTCCLSQQGGNMTGEQFQSCMSGAKDYETKIVQVATSVSEAQAAQQQGNSSLAEEKKQQAKEAASAALDSEKKLAEAVKDLSLITTIKRAEQEPNNSTHQYNQAEIGVAIAGEITTDDSDYFRFKYEDAKNRRDVVGVHVEPQGATLQPSVALFNEDRSSALGWNSANTPGANFDLTFIAEPGKSYYVAVAGQYHSTGKYALSVNPKKAYDQYEPNDDAASATAINFGQTVEANIMDQGDRDYYRLSGIKGAKVVVQLSNKSTTLQPLISILNADKSIALNGTMPNAAGADFTVSFTAEAGKEYYIVIEGHFSTGQYSLTTHG